MNGSAGRRLWRAARATKAFVWGRKISSAVALLRLVLAYCLGERGLRLTAAWAAATQLADISNPGLLYRVQQCADWLGLLIGHLLTATAPRQSQGRLIRIVDATTVLKAGRAAKRQNGLWRVHAAFELPSERFGHLELTDEHGGERLDRIGVIKGEIRIGDAGYMQPDGIAEVLARGGDVVVRSGWRNGRWLDEHGKPVSMINMLQEAKAGLLDVPIWVGRKKAEPLALRLVAVRKPEAATAEARRRARLQASKSGYQVSRETLEAAEWVILITSLRAADYSTADILALYRLRWRVELAFKRLKSLIGLRSPPGSDPRSAKVFILAHLLVAVLLEPWVDVLEDSPRWAHAA